MSPPTPCTDAVLPPIAGLLNQLFNLMYDVEVVAEDVFVSWRDHGREGLGKGFAVQSVKTFFEWLESAETESDEETAS